MLQVTETVRPHVENNFLDWFDTDDTPTNRLILGDNKVVLQDLLAGYREKVDLVYIDPPFMSGRDFGEYQDRWDRCEYLEELEFRIHLLYGLLAPTGSIYVHLDDSVVHYVKVAMDSVFYDGKGGFFNHIVWKRTSAHNDANRFGRIADHILAYSKDLSKRYWKEVSGELSDAQLNRYEKDDGGWYKAEELTAPGFSATRTVEWRGAKPKDSRQWRYSLEELEKLMAAGRILLRRDGAPRFDGLKTYLHETKPPSLQNIWTDIVLASGDSERVDYPTQKPVELLDRIVRASCPPGGLVLDCYLGSGTTAEAAERLGCRWIGIDCNERAIELAKQRLIKLHHAPKPPRVEKSYSRCDGCCRVLVRESTHSTGYYKVKPFTVEHI